MPEGTIEKTKIPRVASVPAKFGNGKLPIISPENYHYTNLVGSKLGLKRSWMGNI